MAHKETRAPDRPDGDRIAKLLARAGVASRREVERMIGEGRVALNGKTVDTPATFLESLRGITVDGKPVGKAEPTRLFAFHKPVGLLTAERDPGAAHDLRRAAQRVAKKRASGHADRPPRPQYGGAVAADQ